MNYIINFEGSPVKYIAESELNLKVGDDVVCDTLKGLQIAKILGETDKAPENQEEFVEIKKLASASDLSKAKSNKIESEKVFKLVKKKVKQENLDMKIDEVFISLDNSKTTILFTSEERVDFRNLVKDLAAELKTRIELKQIGARDEVRCMGGFGPCGKVCCCKEFINDFEHVTIKMAKTQNLSLNPTKISGLCGRLMCCLGYENNHYAETAALMPKINTEVSTPSGKGIVSYNDLIKRQVTVKFGTETPEYKVFELKDISWNKK